MFRKGFILLIMVVLFACENSKDRENLMVPSDIKNSGFNDSFLTEYPQYASGDVRRYGVFPNQPISQEKLQKVLKLAQEGLAMKFPKGVYDTNLIIEGLQNITIICNGAIITGSLQITDLKGMGSSDITIKGSITILDKVFIKKSSNIFFDALMVKSDTLQNAYHKMNRGVSIYAGSKNIRFKKLQIFDTGGSDDVFYKYSAAALQVHGWNNNPEFITIDDLSVENSQRTAVYLTGNNHKIKRAIIKNYALNGDRTNMFGLEDAKPGSEKEFAGFWLNKCNNCKIDSLEISNVSSLPKSLKFGIGTYSKPAIINYLRLNEKASQAPIEDDLLTNVLVKHEY